MRPELGIVRVPRKDSFIERTRQPPQMLNRDGMQRDSLVSLPFVAGGFGSGECRSRVNVNVRPLEREQLPDVSTGHVRHHDQRAPLIRHLDLRNVAWSFGGIASDVDRREVFGCDVGRELGVRFEESDLGTFETNPQS